MSSGLISFMLIFFKCTLGGTRTHNSYEPRPKRGGYANSPTKVFNAAQVGFEPTMEDSPHQINSLDRSASTATEQFGSGLWVFH